jgi:hypothetical protein
MSSFLPVTTALLLATGVALSPAHADPPDRESSHDRVAFEDSSPSADRTFDSEPRTDATEPAPTHAPAHHAPRFEIAVGAFTSTRSLQFDVSDATPTEELPMTSPQSTAVGAQVSASVFPLDRHDSRGRMIGPGISVGFRHSIGNSAAFYDEVEDEYLDLPAVDTGWSIGLRYRQPIGPLLVEVNAAHDSASHRVDEQPDWLELPDAEYRSIATGARIELAVGGGAAVAIAGHYHYVLDAGELMSVDGYGSGAIAAYDLHAALDVPLGKSLFAAADLGYRRVAMTFAGDGALSALEGNDVPDVRGAIDRTVDAQLALGVRY